MNGPQMVNRVNMLLDKINSFQADTLLDTEVYAALNIAQENFVKQRFGRANKYGKGFEENQKRLDDISHLILDAVMPLDYSEDIGNGFYRDIVCQLPSTDPTFDTGDLQDGSNSFSDYGTNMQESQWTASSYMFLISVRAHISYRNCNNPLIEDEDWQYVPYTFTDTVTNTVEGVGTAMIEVNVNDFELSQNNEIGINHLGRRIMFDDAHGIQAKEGVLCKYVQNDDIFELLKDPFNKPTLDGPLYTMAGFIGQSTAGAAATQTNMNRAQIEIYTDNTFIVDSLSIRYIKKPDTIHADWGCQLADHTHMEIVNMAVDLLLESMSDPRYKSHQMETLKSD